MSARRAEGAANLPGGGSVVILAGSNGPYGSFFSTVNPNGAQLTYNPQLSGPAAVNTLTAEQAKDLNDLLNPSDPGLPALNTDPAGITDFKVAPVGLPIEQIGNSVLEVNSSGAYWLLWPGGSGVAIQPDGSRQPGAWAYDALGTLTMRVPLGDGKEALGVVTMADKSVQSTGYVATVPAGTDPLRVTNYNPSPFSIRDAAVVAQVTQRVLNRTGIQDCADGAAAYVKSIVDGGVSVLKDMLSTQLKVLPASTALAPAARDVQAFIENPFDYKSAATEPVKWLCGQLAGLVADYGIGKVVSKARVGKKHMRDVVPDLIDVCDAEAACVWGAGKGFIPQPPGGKYFDELIPELDGPNARAYESIRQSTTDVAEISALNQIDQGVIEQVKKHIFFTEHEIFTGPGLLAKGFFTPDSDIAQLWPKAAQEALTGNDLAQFRSILAHEYTELQLMKQGLPYRSGAAGAWGPNGNRPTSALYGAHDLSPLPFVSADPFKHYDTLLEGRSKPVGGIADNLSNLDAIYQQILEEERRLGRR